MNEYHYPNAMVEIAQTIGRYLTILGGLFGAVYLAATGVLGEEAVAGLIGSAIGAVGTAAGMTMVNGRRNGQTSSK